MRKKEKDLLFKSNKDTRLYVDSLRSEINYLHQKIDDLKSTTSAHAEVLKAAGIIEALEINEDYVELNTTFGKSLYKVNEVF